MNCILNNGNDYTYKTKLPLTCTACKIDVKITFIYFQMLVHYFHIRCNIVKMPHQGKNDQFFVPLETQCYWYRDNASIVLHSIAMKHLDLRSILEESNIPQWFLVFLHISLNIRPKLLSAQLKKGKTEPLNIPHRFSQKTVLPLSDSLVLTISQAVWIVFPYHWGWLRSHLWPD